MEFMTRKAVRKMSSKEVGRKRVREGDSSGMMPPQKVPAVDSSATTTSSTAPGITIPAMGVAIESTISPSATVLPAEVVGDEMAKQPDSSVQCHVDPGLDLELSLRQKMVHDVDAGNKSRLSERVNKPLTASKEVDILTSTQEGDDDEFEVVARAKNKPLASADVGRHVAGDNVSSSDGGTFEFMQSRSHSGTLHGDSGPRVDQIDKIGKILPANQKETLFESAVTHGLNISMEGLEHDIEQRAEDDRPADLIQLPLEKPNEVPAMEFGSSSTSNPQLAMIHLGDRILAALDEQKRALEDQRKSLEDQTKDMKQILANQMGADTAAGLAQGVIFDLRTLMSRSPYKGTLNVAFCGLMVAARLGHLTPYILEDPVVQILLGDHIDELRHVINSVVPYQHNLYPGQQ